MTMTWLMWWCLRRRRPICDCSHQLDLFDLCRRTTNSPMDIRMSMLAIHWIGWLIAVEGIKQKARINIFVWTNGIYRCGILFAVVVVVVNSWTFDLAISLIKFMHNSEQYSLFVQKSWNFTRCCMLHRWNWRLTSVKTVSARNKTELLLDICLNFRV